MPTITATVQTGSWPPRVLVTVTGGATGANPLTIWRDVGGTRTAVRGTPIEAPTDTSTVLTDAEAPFGVAATYVLDQLDVETSSSPVTVTLTRGRVALTDAITGQAAEVDIVTVSDLTTPIRAAQLLTSTRVVVVHDARASTRTLSLEVLARTETEAVAVRDLLDGATSSIVQVRGPSQTTYPGVDRYLTVTGQVERRLTPSTATPVRLFALDCVEVTAPGWDPDLEARGYTLDDIASAYSGLTLADLAGDFATLLAVAVFDWGA